MSYTNGMKNFKVKSIRSGKEIIQAEYKVVNSGSTKDDEEFGTGALENEVIEKLVREVNAKGIPMLLTISFEEGYNKKFASMQIPILPECVRYRKDDPKFLLMYEGIGNAEDTRELAIQDEQNNLYNLEGRIKTHSENIKEFIRRELIKKYLTLKIQNSEHSKLIPLIEGYKIINSHYDISKIQKSDIDYVSIKNQIERGPQTDEIQNTIDAILRVSKVYQIKAAGTNRVCFINDLNGMLVGLDKGSDFMEMDTIARKDTVAAQTCYDLINKDNTIVNTYYRSKAKKPVSQPATFGE